MASYANRVYIYISFDSTHIGNNAAIDDVAHIVEVLNSVCHNIAIRVLCWGNVVFGFVQVYFFSFSRCVFKGSQLFKLFSSLFMFFMF